MCASIQRVRDAGFSSTCVGGGVSERFNVPSGDAVLFSVTGVARGTYLLSAVIYERGGKRVVKDSFSVHHSGAWGPLTIVAE